MRHRHPACAGMTDSSLASPMRADQLLVERGLAADALAGAAPDRGRRCAGSTGAAGTRRQERRRACPTPRELELQRRRRGALRLARRPQAGRRAARSPALDRRAACAASTSASPPAASPTACCSTARRRWSASTSATASCTRSCATTRASSCIEKRQRPRAGRSAPARAGVEPGFDLVVGDLSFISLTLVLPALAPLLHAGRPPADAGQAAVRAAARPASARAASCATPRSTRASSSACATACADAGPGGARLVRQPDRRRRRQPRILRLCTEGMSPMTLPISFEFFPPKTRRGRRQAARRARRSSTR